MSHTNCHFLCRAVQPTDRLFIFQLVIISTYSIHLSVRPVLFGTSKFTVWEVNYRGSCVNWYFITYNMVIRKHEKWGRCIYLMNFTIVFFTRICGKTRAESINYLRRSSYLLTTAVTTGTVELSTYQFCNVITLI